MKVIDLLNKIANGEESDIITEFEFDKRVWNFKALNDSEFCLDAWLLNQDITITKTKHKEVLEEEKKIPEKIEEIENGDFLELPSTHDIMNKINEIIDYLDYLKSKGE